MEGTFTKWPKKAISTSRQLPSVGYVVENRQWTNTFNTIEKCGARLLGARKSARMLHPDWPFVPSYQSNNNNKNSASLWIAVHSALRAVVAFIKGLRQLRSTQRMFSNLNKFNDQEEVSHVHAFVNIRTLIYKCDVVCYVLCGCMLS